MKENENALKRRIEVGQFAELSACVIKQLPRDIDPDVAQGWIKNPDALKRVLRGALCPPVKGGLKEIFAPFLTETFTQWYDKETATRVEQKLLLIKPEDIDWEALGNDIDKTKFGEYSLNPETQGLNFESFHPEKIKVLEFKEFVGKPRAELAKHLALNYGDKYHIPGIEYWKYVVENPNKAPTVLKDGSYQYFFGSTLRNRGGLAYVPRARWDGDRFNRDAHWLGSGWYSDGRVVLLEK